MASIAEIQHELKARGIGAWLFYDHHHRDPIAYRILGLPEAMMVTRRWYYLVPAEGTPQKLAHRIESSALDGLPGERTLYSQWGELEAGLKKMLTPLGAAPRVAMQYSAGCALPAVSLADAGTVEQIRALGGCVVSSGDLISRFDATWTKAMLASHKAAGGAVDAAIQGAFQRVREHLQRGERLTEHELQHWIHSQLRNAGMESEDPPIVAVNAHAADPHYQPTASASAAISAGDLLLLDVWATPSGPDRCFYDVTWMGYCLRPGESAVPAPLVQFFDALRQARDAGVALATSGREGLRGFEVDQAVRGVVAKAGLADFFVHRTGHSLGRDVHATGANMDDFETHDERLILPRTAFTIEPGLYAPHGQPVGLRTEINIYVDESGRGAVTGPMQSEIVRI
ncbi:MAG TPA: M24 family metallopeptidase [Terriglobales bacterium]|nr:M24 family metallopeptidase [Terriglobales bacterium]